MSEHQKPHDSSLDVDKIENGRIHEDGVAEGLEDPVHVDHRAEDDRADAAKGRNSDKFDDKYWLSVNYIGTLFAIGMAFMGGIGGESFIFREVVRGEC